jgi:hypothetical protein
VTISEPIRVEPPEGDTVALRLVLNTYTDNRPKTILLFALIFAEPISFFHYFQQIGACQQFKSEK